MGSTVDMGVFGVSVGIAALFVLWGVFFLANGLEGLQQAATISAAPFVLVMIAMCYSLMKELRAEPGTAPERRAAPEPERAARPPGVPVPQQMRAERDARER